LRLKEAYLDFNYEIYVLEIIKVRRIKMETKEMNNNGGKE